MDFKNFQYLLKYVQNLKILSNLQKVTWPILIIDFISKILAGVITNLVMNRHWNHVIYNYFVPTQQIYSKSYIKFHNIY
jgi:hypothetical protein